ncbi:MAG: hypothetical protein HYV13_04035 [Candidatus Doudnabacteria bacterium]|nr:hypothetical protein [Candidatus Doudnabacteria bacterium]
MLSFIERERLEFLQECLKRKPNFKAFAEKYHWSQNNYTGHKALDKNYFQNQAKILLKSKNREQVQREIRGLQSKALNLKKHQTQLLAEFSLTPRMAKTFELLRIMSRWIDERKFGALHMIYYVDSLLDEIIRRTKVPKDLLNYYTPEEAVNLLIKKVKLDSRIPKQRRRFSVIVTSLTKTGLDEKIYVGKQAQAIFDRFRTRQVQSFWGFVASAPVRRFKGQVCVVINPHKEKFIDGRILVTTMTRPDFVPFMHKASAIITDEGGITSHAAIVSRELGIPCIIGTKVATKVLKTGDLVEVDANLGMVKILTKAKK